MSFAKEAFMELFPERDVDEYALSVTYTDRFKPYNANVKYGGKSLKFNFSRKWESISKEIQIGLLQELMLKVFKEKKKSLNIDLYNNFMKHVHIAAPKVKSDPYLESTFTRLNDSYFGGMLEKPNFDWHNSTHRLGSYEFGSDTISMSTILRENEDALAYVMYHEMLHKHMKFSCSNGKTRHHTREFRNREAQFENAALLEKELTHIVRKSRMRRMFFRQ
jgi:hypothetical protein